MAPGPAPGPHPSTAPRRPRRRRHGRHPHPHPTHGSRPPSARPPAASPGKRTVTLVNRLDQTIWPAIAADPKHPVEATGWVLRPGASVSFAVPDHWDVRVWARTGCSFDAAGDGHCLTGDCGHFQCGSTWGEFPSTLGEFNLNAWNGMDFYDVSLVEGNNLPMWINSYGGSSHDKIDANGCSAAGCTRDANATCPAKLQRVRGGRVVACLSACLVFKTDKTCCTGAYAARPQCVPSSWPVDSAAVFKKAEPFAYSYVNDDATSVLTCSGECGYRITWGVSP
ncbi:thaumatin family protein [Streptomyces sp. NPDC051576]|uniref:thaumatin family protein n=1 Tax=Streptomyces sp. NPDC051576 TaxID=3155803 RepID=UPI00343874CF